MRILFVSQDLLLGGPQTRILELSKGLIEYGIEMIMIAPKGESLFAKEAESNHFKVYQITMHRPHAIKTIHSFILNLKYCMKFPLTVWYIIRIIKRDNVDIAYFNGLLNLQVAVAAYLTKRKIVWCLSSSVYPKLFVKCLMPAVNLIADRIILINIKLQKYYFGNLKNIKKLKFIYEGIDINKFFRKNVNKKRISDLRKKLSIPYGSQIVGYIANISPVKDPKCFVMSCKKVIGDFPDVKFIMAGLILKTQKEYYESVKKLLYSLKLEKNIILIPESVDSVEILSLCDVFVLSSISEGGPRTVLEAMSMELPVVATDVGAVSNQIVNGESGIIVRPGDWVAMGESIAFLLKHFDKRIEMGRKARQRVVAFFSNKKAVEEHGQLFFLLLKYKNKEI